MPSELSAWQRHRFWRAPGLVVTDRQTGRLKERRLQCEDVGEWRDERSRRPVRYERRQVGEIVGETVADRAGAAGEEVERRGRSRSRGRTCACLLSRLSLLEKQTFQQRSEEANCTPYCGIFILKS